MPSPTPTLTCHACGYNMQGRKTKDPCPECAAPFDTRPDAYTKPWALTVPLYTSAIAILIMPALALISLLLMYPAFRTASIHKKINPNHRTPHWAQRRLNQNQFLIWIAIVEFAAIMIISNIWPQTFNFW